MGANCMPCCAAPKIPNITLTVNSSCCRDNTKMKVYLNDEQDLHQIKELLHQIHRSSIKKQTNSLTNLAMLNSNINL